MKKLLIFSLLAILFTSCHMIYSGDYTIIKVNSKEAISTGQGNIRYFIYTDNEVFTVEDKVVNGFFNSSDIYNQIHEGSTYKVRVTGKRIPILSEYRNINKIMEKLK